MLNVTYN